LQFASACRPRLAVSMLAAARQEEARLPENSSDIAKSINLAWI